MTEHTQRDQLESSRQESRKKEMKRLSISLFKKVKDEGKNSCDRQ